MTLEPPPELKRVKFLRPILILTILTVVMYVSQIGLAVWNFSVIQQNKTVLCGLKSEHERDIRNSVKFLKENPEGIPPSITAELIRQGIADDRQTLKAFDDLTCPLDE